MPTRVTTACFAVAVACWSIVSSPASAEDTKLTVMVFQGMQNLAIFGAQANGFFAKRGLAVDVKITPSSEVMRKGLADGEWQIIHTAVDNGVAMAEVAKVDIAVVSGGDNGFNHLIVRPDIKSVADLKGKTVIVDAPDTAFAFELYEILKRNGVNKNDYNVKVVGATYKRLADILAETDSKASMLNPPFWLRAVHDGMKDMGTATTMIGPYQGTATVVLRSWAKDHPDVLVKYLQAYIEGLRWALDPKNKNAAIGLLTEGLKVTPEVAAATYAIAADPTDGLAKDAKLDKEGFDNVLKLRRAWTDSHPGAAEKYLDLSYYQKALAGL
jgi:ABC-type nitrate/sulfonate/bicarbonate transport system substrate-binding protein